MTAKESDIDAVLRIARKVHPDVYERCAAVARIIDPGAFADGWESEPPEAAEVLRAKLRYQQSAALCKAQEVLTFLGVNTQTDWATILQRFAEDGPQGER